VTDDLHRARAREPFEFNDYDLLVQPTGRRAANLRELLTGVREVPVGVIHHHLYSAALRHQFPVWDHPNDFAVWAADSLEDHGLAEKLAALDPYANENLETAREVITDLVEDHLDQLPVVPFVRPGLEFHFCSGFALALPSGRQVHTVRALRDAIAEIPLSSLYYHFHEARLRGPGDDSDDFSRWIDGQFGESEISRQLRTLDFYFYDLQDLRERIVEIFDENLAEERR